MLISPALAQTGGGVGGLGGIEGLMPFILIAVVFYFLLIRPQQKRQKDHKTMVANLRRGDKVVTAGGIIGTVAKAPTDTELVVEIAEGVKVNVARATISEIISKTEPADGGKAGPKADAGGGGGGVGGLLGMLTGRKK
jgi:preprotein translocase subunit YajC